MYTWQDYLKIHTPCCCCLVTKSCPTLWDPMNCSAPGFPGLHYAHQDSLAFTMSWSLLKLMSIEWGMPSNHLILCRPLLLLPSHVTITQIKTDNIPIFLERYLIALSSQSSIPSLEISLLIHITIYLYCYMIFIMLNFI